MDSHNSKTNPKSSAFSKKNSKQNTEVETPFQKPVEVGGPKGPEPTRYGDWEKAGRCTDF